MILDEIMAARKEQLAREQKRVSFAEMQQRAAQTLARRTPVSLAKALRKSTLSCICEVKKASPSKGLICPDFHPVEIAKAYEAAGANAISCLTEERYFQGSSEYLAAIRQEVQIPILRKDFIFDSYQIYEAAAIGADALLLIAAVLEPEKLAALYQLAYSLGLEVLVEVHSREELEQIVNGYVSGEVTDYQMAAWMMAVYLRGMTNEETAELTDVMAHSGVMVDLSPIPGIKVDKHSTGGVGDKTTLVIAPIVAACGVKIAKMSGRGLGHTGGTIDKMESVPGTKTALSQEEFFAQVNRIGLSVIGQSEGIAVADKKMYALRDVTATVSCIPLIASSIMSKKLASGSDAILLDVTTGTGAFMKTVDQSIELAQLMVAIGTHHGRRVAAMITDMDTPLGHNIGNSLEVMESMDVLKGHGPADLTEVCLQLAANMLVLAGKGDAAHCRAMAEAVIADGSAFAKCKEMFAAQGGDIRVLDDYSLFAQPAASYELLAEQDGYIVANDAEKIGSASVLLGAGRQKKGDPLDFAAGITLHKKRGDYVHKGESLATFYGAADKFEAAAAEYRSGLVYGAEKPEEAPLVYALVTKDGVERY